MRLFKPIPPPGDGRRSLVHLGRLLGEGIADLLYPPVCLLCREPLPPGPGPRLVQVCPSCLALVRANRPPFCRCCSRPLANPRLPLCLPCRRRPPAFDRAWAACLYTDPLRRLVHLFKYGGKTGLRHLFVARILRFLEEYRIVPDGTDLVLPIPLFPARYRERGYNQALLLAEPVAGALGAPVGGGILVRSRNTVSQTALDRKQRWTNIHGAFTIKHPGEVYRKHVLVIDDLLTSGATCDEAARALKLAGARRVDVLVLAVAGSSATMGPKPA